MTPVSAFIAAAGLANTQPVEGAEWWIVAAAPEAVAFVDLASVARSGEVATATIEYREPATATNAAFGRVRLAYDCGNAASAVLAEQSHAGDAAASATTHGRAAEAVLPGTLGKAVQAFVCGTDTYRLSEGDRLVIPTARAARRFFALSEAGVEPLVATVLAARLNRPPRAMFERWIPAELRARVEAILTDN